MNWILKLFTGREFMPLTSYDDLVPLNEINYQYTFIQNWLNSCKDFSQMDAVLNSINLFKKHFPKEKALSQHLYRAYWILKREFINN